MAVKTQPRVKPKLAVYKFASCDGCQLSLLNCEDELLAVSEAVEIAYFPEASRAVLPGPYDLVLVEGSITTPHDAERIHQIRKQAKFLVSIGACATSGGIQALRNWENVGELARHVYPHPEYLSVLKASTPISYHVDVDFELRGCPIDKGQLLELVASVLQGRRPRIPAYSVCVECKRLGSPCVMVASGVACMGPVTQAGCGALCPAFSRGCYGCFGPSETSNTVALLGAWESLGVTNDQAVASFRSFNAWSEAFRRASDAAEGERHV